MRQSLNKCLNLSESDSFAQQASQQLNMLNSGDSEAAVRVRGAVKSYSSGKDHQLVLDHLDMTVPKGCIYGLLGASGCGKTTLLSCIVGRLKLDAGELTVLGGVPGSKDSGVPGPRLGYMPQELALAEEFTVKDAFYYFGWLFGMNNQQIAPQFTFLSNLLQLPPDGKFVRNLSGGQQRRLSFAVSLVQTPELLILDEPTVGLDPVLRQNIWDYLMQISRDQNMTVILTTHYIEEARQAHKVGLMREGTLLAETTPSRLIAQNNCSTLEEVLLILSRRQEAGESFRNNGKVVELDDEDPVSVGPESVQEHYSSALDVTPTINTPPVHDVTPTINTPPVQPIHQHQQQTMRPQSSLLSRMKAQMYKNSLRIIRNPGNLFFVFLFPLIQTTGFFIAVGGNLHGLNLGVVNDELGDCNALDAPVYNYSRFKVPGQDIYSCRYSGLSCLFMSKLDDDTTINIYYDSVDRAKAATRSGKNVGVLYFPSNFSESLAKRGEAGLKTRNDVTEGSEVSVWLDMSDAQIGKTMQVYLLKKYVELAEEMATDCNFSIKNARIPIKFNEPVLGKKEPNFTHFMAPGMIISMAFFFSLASTTTIIITERSEGLWDRNLQAGVSTAEIVTSHLIIQCILAVIQMAGILLVGFFVFDLQCLGSFPAMLMLLTMQGLTGVAFGILVSAVCRDIPTAGYVSLGIFYPYLLMSGMMWPIEGMPPSLRFVGNFLPGTWATTALRNVMDRGWEAQHPEVWPGFVISFVWIVLPSVLCFALLRRQISISFR